MTDERWADLLGQLTDDKKIISRTTEELEGRPGSVERVVISSPLGELRLSRASMPRRVNEKALYSKRGSSTAAIEAKYDESDIVHTFTVEQALPNGDWQEMTLDSLPL